MEAIRRQRYNQWALGRIEIAIHTHDQSTGRLYNDKDEKEFLIKSLVDNLAEIEPNLLEASVAELYNDALDATRKDISNDQKIALAKRLTNPDVTRKNYDDF